MTRRVLGAILVIGVVGACSAPGAPTSGGGSSPPPSEAASSLLTSSPPVETGNPPLDSPGPRTPSPANDAPGAVLVIGADRHPGEVGGFTFGSYSQSAPWLPATALETVTVRTGATFRVELDDRASIASWTARLATAADATADAVTGLAEGDGPTAAFASPSIGDWVLSVTISYAKGLGSGAYYWHVVVD